LSVPVSARQLVVVDAAASRADDAVEEASERALVYLRALGRESNGIGRGVIADRGNRPRATGSFSESRPALATTMVPGRSPEAAIAPSGETG